MDFDKTEALTTVFAFYLPYIETGYWTHPVPLTHQGVNASVRNFVINDPSQDPYFEVLSTNHIGVNIPGIETLSLLQLSDHKGNYPVWATEITVYSNISFWVEANIKSDEIMGSPPNEDKIFALRVWKEAARSVRYERHLDYDMVTLFIIRYFRQNGTERCWMVNALTSNSAYRNKVREFLFDKKLLNLLAAFEEIKTIPEINSEVELFEFVKDRSEEVFTLHVEYRRWIEAFWNGSRKVRIEGTETSVPAEPKGETQIQPTIHVLLHEMFSSAGIQVVRESDEGIGNLDFRLMFTTKAGKGISVAIEFKLAHHKRLMHGVKSQLPAYMDATRTNHGLFLVFWFKDTNGKFFKEPRNYSLAETRNNLMNEAKNVSEKLNKTIEAIVVDASIRSSASVE